MPNPIDVLIVGAGLSGIGAACHLKARCPDRTFAIVEARERLGGTWDLFRYPGIRSDSDMYTLGYSFRPWPSPQVIADGPSILSYMKETANAHGIEGKIRYGQRAEHASWSSASATWTVTLRDAQSGAASSVECRFLYLCTGYYEYDAGYMPEFPGLASFGGRVVHPQQWTPDVEYAGKRVVVIGSGATAITLVPELAKTAAHVTMLQRSPSYIVSVPGKDHLVAALGRWTSPMTAYRIARWRNVFLAMGLYAFARRLPRLAARTLIGWAMAQLGGRRELLRHFTPQYGPWDQRLCIAPDGDFFQAIKSGRASVVTDHIEAFTETGIRLRSGTELAADLIVAATGLKMRLAGGMRLTVDGRPLDLADGLVYRGMMGSDTPNLAFAMGYTNASWTLKVDLVARYVCRLLNYMAANGYVAAWPRPPARGAGERPLLGLTSGYVQRAAAHLPKQGRRAPWRAYQNYLVDRWMMRWGRIDADMEFVRAK